MKYKFLLILLFILSAASGRGQESNGGPSSVIQSSMIWSTGQPDGEQVYVAFRKGFDLPGTPGPVILHRQC